MWSQSLCKQVCFMHCKCCFLEPPSWRLHPVKWWIQLPKPKPALKQCPLKFSTETQKLVTQKSLEIGHAHTFWSPSFPYNGSYSSCQPCTWMKTLRSSCWAPLPKLSFPSPRRENAQPSQWKQNQPSVSFTSFYWKVEQCANSEYKKDCGTKRTLPLFFYVQIYNWNYTSEKLT